MQKPVWLAISYSVPINPSKARVYVWRKLKEFGAEYLRQGIAVLPNTGKGMQQFTTLASKICQMGGEATIMEMRFMDPADEIKMTARFKKQMEDEYRKLLLDCAGTLQNLRANRQMVTQKENERIKQMIRRYRKARERDYFDVDAASEIEDGINELIDNVREVATDFAKQLRALMEN